MRTIVWFRGKDLRIADHAPLAEAAMAGEAIPLFVLDPYFFAPERAQRIGHRIQFLLESLSELSENLRSLGSRLIVVPGRSVDVVPRLAALWKAERVVAHAWAAPVGRERDRRIAAALGERFRLYDGETLSPPGSIRSGTGKPYAVFSAFARAWRRDVAPAAPRPTPPVLPRVLRAFLEESVPILRPVDLGLVPNPKVQPGGERAAQGRLNAFLRGPGPRYAEQRDRLDLSGTSRLSADLKFGTLSIRQVFSAARKVLGDTASGRAFENELLWREFAHSILWDRPDVLHQPFRAEFADFPWRTDAAGWQAWVEGATGYPVVDAAARQLLAEGFVHNRARMIAASFLAKHLMIDYKRGEAHYLEWLTDGDWAQNNMGWQWCAGCGCDAQPYFRVMNPVAQGRRFDPEGSYVRHYLPELARLPARFVHSPWEAPEDVLQRAGVRLGRDYPRPIVEHSEARRRYLATARAHLARRRRR